MVEVDHRKVPKYACIVLSALAFLFDAISFFSFNWIESFPEFNSRFTNLGLWAACFNKYIHPEDYVSKYYEGCWFIYWPEYKYIRDWLTPGWFISVQVFACICFICNLLAFIILLLGLLKKDNQNEDEKKQRKSDLLPIILQLTATLLYMYIVTWVGVMSKDRNWLPRPDQNRVGWSFALAVMAGFCSAYAFIFLCIQYCMTHMKQGNPWNRRGSFDDTNGHDGNLKETMPMSGYSEPDNTVSAATASAKHREQMERMQQQRSRLASAASSTYGGPGPRPAVSHSRLAGGTSQTQLAVPTLTDSTV